MRSPRKDVCGLSLRHGVAACAQHLAVRLASTLLPLHACLQPPHAACLQAIRQLGEAQCKVDSHTARSPPLALIVDGKALLTLLAQPWRQQLLQVAEGCAVVVCCRVSPQQKAEVVECALLTHGHHELRVTPAVLPKLFASGLGLPRCAAASMRHAAGGSTVSGWRVWPNCGGLVAAPGCVHGRQCACLWSAVGLAHFSRAAGAAGSHTVGALRLPPSEALSLDGSLGCCWTGWYGVEWARSRSRSGMGPMMCP